MSDGYLQFLQEFDAASAMLPLGSTRLCFAVRLQYFKDTEVPSLPLAKSYGTSHPLL